MSAGKQNATLDDLLGDQQNFHTSAINELRTVRKTAEQIAATGLAIEKVATVLMVATIVNAFLTALAILF